MSQKKLIPGNTIRLICTQNAGNTVWGIPKKKIHMNIDEFTNLYVSKRERRRKAWDQ